MKTNIILIIVAIVLFFAGRFTAPKAGPDIHQITIDSLTRKQVETDNQLRKMSLRMEALKNEADQANERAYKSELAKKKNDKKYAQDTAYNHRLLPTQRDSLLWVRYRKDR